MRSRQIVLVLFLSAAVAAPAAAQEIARVGQDILIQTATLLLAMPVFLLLGFGAAVHSGFGSATDWLGRQFGARAGQPV